MRLTIVHLLAAAASAFLTMGAGCEVTRGQESAASELDDATITTQIKRRFVDSRQVDAASVHVETHHSTVMLSGFAGSSAERAAAEDIANKAPGVRAVRNEIALRP